MKPSERRKRKEIRAVVIALTWSFALIACLFIIMVWMGLHNNQYTDFSGAVKYAKESGDVVVKYIFSFMAVLVPLVIAVYVTMWLMDKTMREERKP